MPCAGRAVSLVQVGPEDTRRRSRQEVFVDDGCRRIAAAVVGQPLRGHLRRRLTGSTRPTPGRVVGGHRRVVALAPTRGQCHTARLDFTEPDPQLPRTQAAVAAAKQARLGECAKRRLAQQHCGPVGAGRALDGVDHGDAATGHPPVQIVDVEDARRQVVDVGGPHPRDIGGHRGHPRQLVIPGLVDRFAGQRECADRGGDERLRLLGVAGTLGGDDPGPIEQRGVEQLAAREECLDAATQVGIEIPGVAGGQHRGEHAKRIARQLVCVDGPKSGRYHRNRRGRRTQVVVADRQHAERREQIGDGSQFGRAAHPNGAVSLGGDPPQRAQSFGAGMACHVVAS